MQAVVKMGSSQYLVNDGQKLLVDHSQVDGVLLTVDGDKVVVGTPYVDKASVVLEDLGEVKGDKVRASTYTAKSRSRRTVGFRPKYRQVQVKSITI